MKEDLSKWVILDWRWPLKGLYHTCRKRDTGFYGVGVVNNSEWYCDYCGEVAPEPIQWVATLCKCKRFHPLKKRT